jgi:hypothetical protein
MIIVYESSRDKNELIGKNHFFLGGGVCVCLIYIIKLMKKGVSIIAKALNYLAIIDTVSGNVLILTPSL